MDGILKRILLFAVILCSCGRMEDGIELFKPSITSTEATATAHSVILKALVDKSPEISDYGFYFTEGDNVRKIAANNLAEGRFICTITDLPPETSFVFRAFIGNGVAEILSDEQTVTTLKEPAPTDIVEIPDPTLRQYVLWYFDANKDGYLSVAEAFTINKIDVQSDDVASLGGIEYFRNLESLSVNGIANDENLPSNGKLTKVDLSSNPKLNDVSFNYQNISEINLSCNTEITRFGMFKCPISKIDISALSKIQQFGAGYCQLDSIDLSHNPNLDDVHLDKNKLQRITIGKNESIHYLDLTHNLLKEVDISGCPNLRELYCTENPYLETVYVRTGQVFSVFKCDSHVKIVTKD